MNTRSGASGFAWAFAWTLCAALVACGGSDSTIPPATIGPSGGTVTSAQGASVSIPAGALSSEVAIQITTDTTGAAPLPVNIAVSDTFLLTPHGTTFSKPVTLTLPIDMTKVPAGGKVMLLKTDASLRNWAVLPGATVSGASISGSITSFSAPVAVLPPTISQQPIDQTVNVGQSTTFTVVGSPPTAGLQLVYSWESSIDQGATWTVITGANAASYTAPAALASDDGKQFRVTVGLQALPVVSTIGAVARLTVGNAPPAPTASLALLAGQIGASGATLDGTAGLARFDTPIGIATDGAGNLYVADYGGSVIRKVTAAGVVTTLAGAPRANGIVDGTGPAARFSSPRGVAATPGGTVYVADTFNNTIRQITPAGVVTTLAGSAIAPPGALNGTGSTARFNGPEGVAVDAAGNVYVADSGNHLIRKITPGGVVTTPAGFPGVPGSADGLAGTARFNTPLGIAVDGNGDLFVADGLNSTIRAVTPAGVVTTLAGTAGSAGSVDGVGSAARFGNRLQGLSIDAAGNLYVADRSNSTVRKVTTAGTVTTVLGTAGQPGVVLGNAPGLNLPESVVVLAPGRIAIVDSQAVLTATVP
jgi:sugar lactone lactonase YvrE